MTIDQLKTMLESIHIDMEVSKTRHYDEIEVVIKSKLLGRRIVIRERKGLEHERKYVGDPIAEETVCMNVLGTLIRAGWYYLAATTKEIDENTPKAP